MGNKQSYQPLQPVLPRWPGPRDTLPAWQVDNALKRGGARWICGGRLLRGPTRDLPAQCTVYTMLAVTYSLFYGVVLPDAATPLWIVWLSRCVCAPLYWCSVALLLFCSFRDPGVLPRRWAIEAGAVASPLPPLLRAAVDGGGPPSRDGRRWKHCMTCDVHRPPLATHCRACDHCVVGFDHHCPWIGACVTARNRLPFVVMLMLNALLSAAGIFFCLLVLLGYHADGVDPATGAGFVDAASASSHVDSGSAASASSDDDLYTGFAGDSFVHPAVEFALWLLVSVTGVVLSFKYRSTIPVQGYCVSLTTVAATVYSCACLVEAVAEHGALRGVHVAAIVLIYLWALLAFADAGLGVTQLRMVCDGTTTKELLDKQRGRHHHHGAAAHGHSHGAGAASHGHSHGAAAAVDAAETMPSAAGHDGDEPAHARTRHREAVAASLAAVSASAAATAPSTPQKPGAYPTEAVAHGYGVPIALQQQRTLLSDELHARQRAEEEAAAVAAEDELRAIAAVLPPWAGSYTDVGSIARARLVAFLVSKRGRGGPRLFRASATLNRADFERVVGAGAV